jgi:cell division protein FtsW
MERIPLRDNSTGAVMVLTTGSLIALGVVMVHSAVASVAEPGVWYARVDVRHTVFAAAAMLVVLVGWRFDYHRLAAGGRLPWWAAGFLAVAIISAGLVFVPGMGRSVGGCRRWIRVGPNQFGIGFQPSEMLKVCLAIFLAAWLARKDPSELRSFRKTFVPACLVILACVGLTATQDFGASALIGITAGATLLLAGVPLAYLLALIPPAAAGFYALVVRDPDRWGRITAMLDPWSEAAAAYQPQQSLMAILSGGWFGTGTGFGIRKLGYLPEDSTDFIFSVFCEEWGFLGAVLLVGLLVVWILAARRAAARGGDRFGALLAGALGFMIAFQAVFHVAVVLVAAPPTGMSLPFVSAGGTGLLLMSAACAMIVSVTSRRAMPEEAVLATAEQSA